MSVISSVVWPKLAKFVTKPRNDSLVSVILEGYLSCVSPDRYPKLNFVSSGAQGDYEFLQGLLLPVARPRLCNEFIQRTRNRRGLSVAVFSCCVPRELESLEGETVTFTNTADRSMESILIDETVKIIDSHVADINIFCSQKVIHHRIRSHLESHGILVLERLSITYAEDVASLAGTTLSPSISEWEIGKLGGLEMKRIGGKKHLHLQPAEGSHLGAVIGPQTVGAFLDDNN